MAAHVNMPAFGLEAMASRIGEDAAVTTLPSVSSTETATAKWTPDVELDGGSVVTTSCVGVPTGDWNAGSTTMKLSESEVLDGPVALAVICWGAVEPAGQLLVKAVPFQ